MGEGEFGVVYRASYLGTPVAVKVLKDNGAVALGDFRRAAAFGVGWWQRACVRGGGVVQGARAQPAARQQHARTPLPPPIGRS